VFQYKYPRPAVTVDVVLFTILDNELKVLTILRRNAPFKGRWALPGGFINPDETLESAARRELREETGISVDYLEQFHTFDAPERDPRGRIITIAHLALISADEIDAHAASDARAVEWTSIDNADALAFDHNQIVTMGHEILKARRNELTVGLQFMPTEFTLTQLQKAFEAVLQEKMEKRNFRKWVLSANQIEETGKYQRIAAHRPARLYRVKHKEP
jgi:8-oxo-dGTP diphosphatase